MNSAGPYSSKIRIAGHFQLNFPKFLISFLTGTVAALPVRVAQFYRHEQQRGDQSQRRDYLT